MNKTHIFIFCVVTLCSSAAMASVCGASWDGDKVANLTQGKALGQQIRLSDSNGNQLAQLSVAQIKAFHEAKDAIKKVTGRAPQFLICDDKSPNAFATKGANGGDLVGVTVGMMKMVNGDREMAAAVIGHEYAHNIRGHISGAQVRNTVLNVLGAIAGVAIDIAMQDKYGVSGFGQDIGGLATGLAARKFDRDQENEADEDGFNYMLKAGFDPNGAVRLAERFKQAGQGAGGWFFDSHPGWDERADKFRSLLASSYEARKLSSKPILQAQNNEEIKAEPIKLALVPIVETSDAQKSYSDGLEALRNKNQDQAVKLIKASAEAGFAPAQVFIGFSLEKGKNGLLRDELEAVRFYKMAANKDNPVAQSLLGSMYERGRGGLIQDHVKAIEYYKLSAEKNNPQGQVFLGTMYERGLGGLEKNNAEALRLYQLASEQKSHLGQALLGTMFERGVGGVSRDHGEAVRLYRLSAEQGNPIAQNLLGGMYERGQGGLQKDVVEAAKLFQMSAGQGFPAGQASLGRMYEMGAGGFEKNESEALRLYQLSANGGNAFGMALLAMKYMKGVDGVLPKNEGEAVRLYKLSAQQGNHLAKNNLGAAYEFGLGGLGKDVEIAVSYYKEAANLGNLTATNNLKRLNR